MRLHESLSRSGYHYDFIQAKPTIGKSRYAEFRNVPSKIANAIPQSLWAVWQRETYPANFEPGYFLL